MKIRHFYPLIGFAVPTLVIGYGFVIPKSPIAGWTPESIGFGFTVVGACATYVIGLWRAIGRQCDIRNGGRK